MNIDSFKTVCVVGLGRSGLYIVKLLKKVGKKVKVTEKREEGFFSSSFVKQLREQGVEFEFSRHTEEFIKGSDLIVISPGVDLKNTPLREIAQSNGIPIVGEIEFASWFTTSKIVAITGTNGKTTTSFLTYSVLKSARKNVYLAGNIGIPFARCVLETRPDDIVVLEVSSFQLESIIELKPYVACLLNLEPDHLDRYANFDEYISAKLNIFRNQTNKEWAVINKNLFNLKSVINNINSHIVYFSDELTNENFSAVYRIARVFGVSKIDCIKIINNFKGLPHRMQLVRKVKGVTFVNDSKATNPASTMWALKNINSKVILIAGGKDKGLDYTVIKPYLKKVKKINLIGEASDKIKGSLSKYKDVHVFSSLREAVRDAYANADKKDTVLFSPMCASFDMFANYKERGKRFVNIVNSL